MPYWLRWCASRSAELGSALDRLIAAGLLFRQGVPPHASYLFKHALVQDAAYGTLLREPRRTLHARIADTIESQFLEIAENQPELLARHCTEAGLIDKAAGLWGKAGRQSLERSALVEAAEQLKRALTQIAALPATPALRGEEIKLQVALITPLIHVRGWAAPETKAAVERARLLIEQAEALGEPLENPLLLFSVLFGFWAENYVAFNGDVLRKLAAQYLALAEKQGAPDLLRAGHGIMGLSLLTTGDIAEGRTHYNQSLALYDAAEHRSLRSRYCPNPPCFSPMLSVVGFLVPWLSRGCAYGQRARARGCARDRTRCPVDGGAGPNIVDAYFPRELRGSKRAPG